MGEHQPAWTAGSRQSTLKNSSATRPTTALPSILGTLFAPTRFSAWCTKQAATLPGRTASFLLVGLGPRRRNERRRLLFAGDQLDPGSVAHRARLQPASGSDGGRGVECLDGQLPEHSVLRQPEGDGDPQRDQRLGSHRQVSPTGSEGLWDEFSGGQRRPEANREESSYHSDRRVSRQYRDAEPGAAERDPVRRRFDRENGRRA